MFKRIIIILLVPFLAFAANKPKDKNETTKNEIIRFTKKTVESFDEDKTRKSSIEYVYEKPDDIFWKKEIEKDESGTTVRFTEREFDADRFPITEIVTDELGTQTERYQVRYSPDNLQLIDLIEYEGEFKETNKIRHVEYSYRDGYLFTENVTKYGETDYKNADGSNIEYTYRLRFVIPHANRPRGNYEIGFYIERRKVFFTSKMANGDGKSVLKPGDLVLEEYTTFDQDGLPFYYKQVNVLIKDEHAEHRPVEEWFKIEKSGNDGRILSITGFSDKDFTKNSFETARIVFSYDKNGLINKIEDVRFNDTTKKFDLQHDLNTYSWFRPKVSGKYDFTKVSENNIHKCYHGMVHSFSYSEIKKYDKGELVITESSASYPLGKAPSKPELKIDKKIRYKYEIINK